MFNQLFGKKKLDVLLAEAAGDNRLRRALGPVTLTALGIGAVIGAGIFVATGAAAKVGIVVPVALSGSPYKYDQGFFLPNVVAEYAQAEVKKPSARARTGDKAAGLGPE
jgi:hypothetical protein